MLSFSLTFFPHSLIDCLIGSLPSCSTKISTQVQVFLESQTIMAFAQHLRLLYFIRLCQFAFALGFLVLICWCGTHRGYWNNVEAAIAVGVFSSIFTFAVTGYGIYNQHHLNPFAGHGILYTLLRMALEIFVTLLWLATVVLMLRRKTEDFRKAFDRPPFTQWGITVAFALVEM